MWLGPDTFSLSIRYHLFYYYMDTCTHSLLAGSLGTWALCVQRGGQYVSAFHVPGFSVTNYPVCYLRLCRNEVLTVARTADGR